MKNVIAFLLGIAVSSQSFGQGCVAIRTVAGISPDLLFKNIPPGDGFILAVTNRYFEASNSYSGGKFITDTLVRNRLYTLDLSLMKVMNKGWSIALNVPISANSRRNYADHGGLQLPQYTTSAFGLGDIRFSVYKWLLDPTANQKGNIQAGLGIKFATGDYQCQDYFHRKIDSTVLAPVDQAIQLGDGGTGITIELGGFYSLAKEISFFASGFYLINPREQNGVSNLKGRAPTATEIKNNTTVMSVPDQYNVRGGLNIELQKFTLTAALRYEKVPVKDLIGGNKGFRRAASISSVEPGVAYKMANALAFVNVGVPYKRNIVENQQNNMTPAGFANYIFNFGMQFKL
jgi:hypothetical protein